MRLKSRITVSKQIFNIFATTLIFLSSVAIANENEDSRDALRAIIDAVKSPGYIYNGSGSASVVIDENGKKSERILDFKFKDIMSRSDAYALVKGEKGAFEVNWSVNRENSVGYNGYNAVVQSKPSRQFYRTIGYDFHPETFHQFRQLPIEKVLENILNAPGPLHLNLDDKGILHIYAEVDYDDESFSESSAINLDTRNGYKLISWEHKTKNLNGPGSRVEAFYNAEWQKVGSEFYIKKVHFEENSTMVLEHGQPSKPRLSKFSVDVTVNNFVPNPEIQDTEFTLAGLNIPHGTIVVDNIVGINYKYGTGLKGTENLEAPLAEAEFLKSIKDPVGTNKISEDEDTATIEEQTEENTKTSVSNNQFSQKRLVPMLGQHPYRNVLIVVVLLIGIILGLCIVGKLLLIKKGK